MNLKLRISALCMLGTSLRKFVKGEYTINKLSDAIQQSSTINPWFTNANILQAIENVAEWLEVKIISEWTSKYKFSENGYCRVGVIMAGNIPIVGFHDFISVLLSGNVIVVKLSSKDNLLLPAIADELNRIEPEFATKIVFKDSLIENIDALIATGSSNTVRYFDYNFKNTPRILRGNRNSVAILTGNESDKDLKLLLDDIYAYFGLGCRNVSKLYVPNISIINRLIEMCANKLDVLNQKYYSDNIKYQLAKLKSLNINFYNANSLIFINDTPFSTPVGIVNFEIYNDLSFVKQIIKFEENKIQCVVGSNNDCWIAFGDTQKPMIDDYADNIDTLKFLSELKLS